MSQETSMRTRTNATEDEDRERAAGFATSLIRDHFEDPEAWVRLAFSAVEGSSSARVYHFDAFGPTLLERYRVIVSCASADVWEAVLAD
jgi:hypothetical protein